MSVNTPTSPAFTLIDTPLVGLEDVQRAAFYVFFEGFNNALREIAGYWITRDQEYDSRVGTKFAPVELEPIPNANFNEGHKPSLILTGPSSFPNLAVFAIQATPSPESDKFDHMDSWIDSILVEVMVKALETQEEIVNRRIHRATEAAVLCIRRNQDLGGAVTSLSTSPSIDISEVFAVRSPSQGGAYKGQIPSGNNYIWQGSSIRFKVPKDSVLPSSGPNTFDTASQVDYSQYIDQG